LFLDEIADSTVSFQAKLLRVLEEKTFYRLGGHELVPADVRIFSATNQNLRALVKSGGFRCDLFYRLNVVKIATPPLRERKEDIPDLAIHFLGDIEKNLRDKVPAERFSDSAMARLMNYDWPGNARELRNAIEHAAIFARSALIEPGDFPELNEDDSAQVFKKFMRQILYYVPNVRGKQILQHLGLWDIRNNGPPPLLLNMVREPTYHPVRDHAPGGDEVWSQVPNYGYWAE
jgi:DNA-binding NtrC family response regulator